MARDRALPLRLRIVLFLESELGLPPWDVLHQGLAEQLGISSGAANVIVSVVVLLLAWRLKATIGLGTLLNATLIGTFVIGLTAIDAVDASSEESLGVRIGLIAVALVCFGVGSAFYICASLGAGPRDSLMLVTSRGPRYQGRHRAHRARAAALGVGFLLGGTVGVGTLVFAVGIGPVVEVSFWLLGRTPLAAPAVASSAA